jgi:hypothetical protein
LLAELVKVELEILDPSAKADPDTTAINAKAASDVYVVFILISS